MNAFSSLRNLDPNVVWFSKESQATFWDRSTSATVSVSPSPIPTVLVAVFLKLSFLWLFPIVAFWLAVMGPLIVTYSRVIRYHFDHGVDPR